jgi:molybdopterin molybdotransferase
MQATNPAYSCCDDFDPASLLEEEALRRILAQARALPGWEKMPLRSALGRVLQADVLSPVNVPAHVNSAMDGYALASAPLPAAGETVCRVIGTSWAGQPFAGTMGAGECVRIMTGAKLPAGADAVIMQEQVQRDGDQISFSGGVKTGQNVRLAGEDLAAGALAVAAGKRLYPADVGLLASLGIAEVSVTRRVRVAFFSTGDELKSIGEPLGDGDIYDSNRYTLHGMLSRIGVDILDLGVVPDQRDALRQAFAQAAACADVIITSGGVSVGEADFVKEILRETGQIEFWKIAIKPGRPLAFGNIGKALFFGLPGNPVSAMATFYLFAQPALRQMAGETLSPPLRLPALCLSKLRKKAGRLEYQRGILGRDEQGRLTVRDTGDQGSGILSSMSRANCFIVLPLESNGTQAGEWVEIQPFDGMV